ncbi:MAG: hypothetical protein HQ567_25410 [Candidatus Nealsonbacteria bacterium]|nr:hypothetical protein [Candidatus Nealsonbacteria bacterium]
MIHRRVYFQFVLYALVVWLATFCLLALPVRIYDFAGNKYRHLFTHWFQEAMECDEELILLTCLTLWSIACAWAITAATSGHKKVVVPVSLAVGTVVALIVGASVRHAFHGWGEDIFHVAYSVCVTAVFLAVPVMHRRGS